MRWYKKTKCVPQFGDERTIEKFLWFPKRILNEWRWLERAWIVQRYDLYTTRTILFGFPIACEGWADMMWMKTRKTWGGE
jgi:hypothetical protein